MQKLKYIDTINEVYKEIGFIPINGQERAVNQLLMAFLDDKHKNVVLSADTGTGKSIIGLVVARCLGKLLNDGAGELISVHSNSLVEQYKDTYKDNDSVMVIKGKSNYPCDFLRCELEDETSTAEDCVITSPQNLDEDNTICANCQYLKDRQRVNTIQTLITNYSYQFTSNTITNHLVPRLINVFDESHCINDTWASFFDITINNELFGKIKKYYSDDKDIFHFGADVDFSNDVRDKATELMVDIGKMHKALPQVTIDNYMRYIQKITKLLSEFDSYFRKYLEKFSNLTETNATVLKKVTRVRRQHNVINRLVTTLKEFVEVGYEHSFELTEYNDLVIKPIFVGKYSEKIMSDYNLFMSATVSGEYIKSTLELDDVGYIVLDPVYDPSQKPIAFVGNAKLNYQLMKYESTWKYLVDNIKVVADAEDFLGEKGLIFVTSYSMATNISGRLKRDRNFLSRHRIFCHESGQKIDDVIKEFKEYKGSAILISPSIWEGVDFSDDYARYQIITKAPYPSLGEARIKYIANCYSDMYKIMTTKKIIQAVGRGIRNKDDWAYTFVLDGAVRDLFDSRHNTWKNQFEVI